MENEVQGRGKLALVVVGMVLLTGIVVVAILRDAIVNRSNYQVSVTGTGRISYTPDKAKVTLGVQIDRAETAEVALQQLTERVQKITEAVEQLGIPSEDVHTSQYSIQPHYEYTYDSFNNSQSRVVGFDANQQLVVTVKDLTKESQSVSKVIQGATKVGSNQILGITFDVSNVDDLKHQARVAALKDAMEKASATAGSLGVRLGKISGWWDNVVQAPGLDPYGYGYAEGKGGGAGLVPSGTDEVVVEASVSYEIKK